MKKWLGIFILWLLSLGAFAEEEKPMIEGLMVAPEAEEAPVEESTCPPLSDCYKAPSGDTLYRQSWLEGDYQLGYDADRSIASEKATNAEQNNPDPSQVESYLEYLSVLDASGKSEEARKKMQKFIGDHPNEKRAVFLLGVHYARNKKRELALYLFKQLEKDSSFTAKSLVYNNLGILALQDKNRYLALDYLEKATKASPPAAAPFVNLGSLYLQSRSYSDSEKLFKKALELDGDFEDAALGLGASLEGQGKFDDAHRVYADFMQVHLSALSVVYNDAVILGNRLKSREEAAQLMLRYIQRGGKETARAHEIMQSWR